MTQLSDEVQLEIIEKAIDELYTTISAMETIKSQVIQRSPTALKLKIHQEIALKHYLHDYPDGVSFGEILEKIQIGSGDILPVEAYNKLEYCVLAHEIRVLANRIKNEIAQGA